MNEQELNDKINNIIEKRGKEYKNGEKKAYRDGYIAYPHLWTSIHGEAMKNDIKSLVDEAVKVDENTSDGYHTFKELYAFRLAFNAVLFNEWSKQGKYDVHKSIRHSDGELCFGGGWFIVMAQLPTGQISNHYEMKDWNKFKVEEREKANVWDGHTALDVLERLDQLAEQD